MHAVSLEVTDFRNYEHASVALGPGPSVLIGDNGQGKTSLVEAIRYTATLSSHRVAADAALVRIGSARATIRVGVRRGERQAVLDVLIQPGKGARARINAASLPRARDCLGLVRAVLFSPEDLSLVHGDPAVRRRFLDELLVQRHPAIAGVIADSERVLRQRGALLKAVASKGGRPNATQEATLSVWDEQFAVLGARWWASRRDAVAALQLPFEEAYEALSGGRADRPELRYRSGSGNFEEQQPAVEELRQMLADSLQQRRSEEWRRGVNLTGPQRDEMVVLLQGQPARGYASQGEAWSLALALRLASYRLLSAESIDDSDPVLLLDDVFAQLDGPRRSRLAQEVAGAEQVIITAAVADDVPAALSGSKYRVASGRVGRYGQ